MKFQQSDGYSTKHKLTFRSVTLGLWSEFIFNPLRCRCSPKSWRGKSTNKVIARVQQLIRF